MYKELFISNQQYIQYEYERDGQRKHILINTSKT